MAGSSDMAGIIGALAGADSVTAIEALAVLEWCKDWSSDCVWQDGDTIEGMSDAALLRACHRHIEGGLAFVLADVRRLAAHGAIRTHEGMDCLPAPVRPEWLYSDGTASADDCVCGAPDSAHEPDSAGRLVCPCEDCGATSADTESRECDTCGAAPAAPAKPAASRERYRLEWRDARNRWHRARESFDTASAALAGARNYAASRRLVVGWRVLDATGATIADSIADGNERRLAPYGASDAPAALSVSTIQAMPHSAILAALDGAIGAGLDACRGLESVARFIIERAYAYPAAVLDRAREVIGIARGAKPARFEVSETGADGAGRTRTIEAPDISAAGWLALETCEDGWSVTAVRPAGAKPRARGARYTAIYREHGSRSIHEHGIYAGSIESALAIATREATDRGLAVVAIAAGAPDGFGASILADGLAGADHA